MDRPRPVCRAGAVSRGWASTLVVASDSALPQERLDTAQADSELQSKHALWRASLESIDDLQHILIAQPIAQPPDAGCSASDEAVVPRAWSLFSGRSLSGLAKEFLQVSAVRVTSDKLHQAKLSCFHLRNLPMGAQMGAGFPGCAPGATAAPALKIGHVPLRAIGGNTDRQQHRPGLQVVLVPVAGARSRRVRACRQGRRRGWRRSPSVRPGPRRSGIGRRSLNSHAGARH